MIFGKTRRERRRTKWQTKFAWAPVDLLDGRVAWLRPVQWRVRTLRGIPLIFFRLPRPPRPDYSAHKGDCLVRTRGTCDCGHWEPGY